MKKPYLRRIELDRQTIPDDQSYPFSIPAVRALDGLDFHPDVTFLVGENGSGKSTLIEAIALGMGFGPEGGTKNVHLSSANDISLLHHHLRFIKSFARPRDGFFLRAESFDNVATHMDQVGYLGGYGDRSIHARSHGEAFMATLTGKFRGQGLYILDEPEAALSPSRQLAALAAIHDLVQLDSQFIIATHSPILMAYPHATIILLDETGLRETTYEETEHYVVMRAFLNNHERMIQELLADREG
jgi:predicted ATPase